MLLASLRPLSGQTFAAQPVIKEPPTAESKEPEEIIFDKAEQAATLEDQKACLAELEKRLEILEDELSKADDEKKSKINGVIDKLQHQQSLLQKKISTAEKNMEKEIN